MGIASCKDGEPQASETAAESNLKNMVSNPNAYHCDTLKLGAYCHNAHNCMTQEHIQTCERAKSDSCDVNCNAASARKVALTSLFAAICAYTHSTLLGV